MRSLLLVRVGDAEQVDAAFQSGADALVLDLHGLAGDDESAAPIARDILRAAQWSIHRPHLYVRLGDLDSARFDADLAMVMTGEPDGVLLAGSHTAMDVQHLAAKLAVQEIEHGLTDGETSIIAEAGAHARALFGLGSYAGSNARLVGLTWHAERLAADLGSDPEQAGLPEFAPFQTARHLLLFAARAAEVAAIDGISRTSDAAAFLAECRRARQHGFNAKMTDAPGQVAAINAAFGLEAD